jgi:hypothetical protein
MSALTIEYQLNTKQPGYSFSTPPNGYADPVLKAVWRQAMPRGQGWRSDTLIGARSLKCFPVSDEIVALSTTTVTDQVDEQGRRGIRRAEIDFIRTHDIVPTFKALLSTYPEPVQAAARQAFNVATWARIVEGALPKLGRKQSQIVFTHRYNGPDAWQVIEAVVLNLASVWPLRAMPGWGKFFSFTTLALTNEDESRIVAVPTEEAKGLRGARVIAIR